MLSFKYYVWSWRMVKEKSEPKTYEYSIEDFKNSFGSVGEDFFFGMEVEDLFRYLIMRVDLCGGVFGNPRFVRLPRRKRNSEGILKEVPFECGEEAPDCEKLCVSPTGQNITDDRISHLLRRSLKTGDDFSPMSHEDDWDTTARVDVDIFFNGMTYRYHLLDAYWNYFGKRKKDRYSKVGMVEKIT